MHNEKVIDIATKALVTAIAVGVVVSVVLYFLP